MATQQCFQTLLCVCECVCMFWNNLSATPKSRYNKNLLSTQTHTLKQHFSVNICLQEKRRRGKLDTIKIKLNLLMLRQLLTSNP